MGSLSPGVGKSLANTRELFPKCHFEHFEPLSEWSVAGCHANRNCLLSHCQTRKTTSNRGSSVVPPVAAVPGLLTRHDRWAWAATPGPRRPTRTHPGTARDLSAAQEDLHHLAGLAGAVG